jgi:ribosomal protein S18 acetylase RimI-like enzyme
MVYVASPDEIASRLEEFTALLLDGVDSGASVGFMPPLEAEDARQYWRSVIAAQREGRRVVLAAVEENILQGSVQLDLEPRANGNHRGEAMKLLVHRRARRRGLARQLMAELELVARRLNRTLILMDTRSGGEAEKLCDSLGYTRWGEVPEYARSADGQLHSSVFYYRRLT